MGYAAAGNLAWSASGLSKDTACSTDGNTTAINARKAVRTYDARNRIATLTFPDANGNQSWSYTPDGLPASVTTYKDAGASSVVNTYAYNKRRLLTGESQASGSNTWTVGYGYDGNASLSTLVYPDSLTVGYAPNALGQPTQAGSYASNVTYYPNGAIAGFTYGNLIVHTLTQNARGLPAISEDANVATPILQDEYAYDEVGNVLSITDAAAGQNQRGNRDMVYDNVNRLTSATSPMFGTASYSYDALDNLTHVAVTGGSQARDQTYVYDAHNRLTNVMAGGVSVIGLGYDAQGNLINKNGVFYTFDYGNRLRAGGPETHRYDVQGRRIRSSSSVGLVYSLYAQSGQLLFQRDERSGKRRQYIYLGGSLVAESAVPLAGGAATVTYQHTDALGTPVAITNSSKTVIERREYEPYGYQTTPALQDGPNYTGHVADAATGLLYMQQRYYDPELGEFSSTDPVTPFSPGGAFNRYWYGAANPYRFTDPDGRTPNEVYLASGGDWGSGQTVSAGKKNRSVPISKSESAALEAGDLKAFWASRLLRGDPWGREGASIWDRGNPSLSTADLARGELAVRWLLGAMAKRDGLDSSILSRPEGLIGLAQNYRGEITQIGVAVARGHASLVTTNRGNTVGLGDSAVMHHRVFAPFGLPPTAYGGTPLFWGLAPGIQSYYINQIVDFCHGCPR